MYKKNPLNYVAAGKMLLSAPLALASEPVTMPISVSNSGELGNDGSLNPSLSANGRFVAFQSNATDLVEEDSNGVQDIFVHDRLNNTTELVSIDSSGMQANDYSYSPSISADGRYITFSSDASNLDDNDLGYSSDIFVHDRVTGNTTRVSQERLEAQGKSGSKNPAISADGQYITYESHLHDLVANDTNDAKDIFVYDRITDTTTRVSINSSGVQASEGSHSPAISANGQYITYYSDASNLINDDSNEVEDIFVHDRYTGVTSRVSNSSSGEQGNGSSVSPSISGDGRYITYISRAANLVRGDNNDVADVFVHDRDTQSTSRVSISSSGKIGNGDSYAPSISSSGRYIAYISEAVDLVSNDTNGFTDIFVYDQQEGTTSRVNLGESGIEADGDSYRGLSISAHGNYISFDSFASNLVSNKGYIGESNVFVRYPLSPLEPINGYTSSFETTAWPERWYSYGWHLDNSMHTDGIYSLRANPTTDNEETVTEWHVNIANEGELSFDMKVDSEQDHDFFRFYIDDVLQAEYSGFVDWTQYQYVLSQGEHLLRFEYAKDYRNKFGADTAWIDNVRFSNDSEIQRQTDFIERFYVNILGRLSDSEGLAFWLEEIQSISATHVAFGFFNSEEFKALALSDREFLNILYNTIFGRDADQGGLNYWLAELNKGVLRENVLYGFFQSDEFAALAEQSGVTGYSESDHAQFLVKGFVRRLYVNVLGREPEQEGMDYWSDHLFSGAESASDIVTGFFFSNEFVNKNHNDSTFIDIAYLTILNRAADETGKNYWLQDLANGSTRYQLIQGFIYSQEFESLASSYGIRTH